MKMNSSELGNLLRIGLAIVFGILAEHGYMSKDQSTALVTDFVTIAPTLCGIATIFWSIYSHWNMKKVPENSTAITLPDGPAPVGSIIHASMPQKVVGVLAIGFCLAAFPFHNAFAAGAVNFDANKANSSAAANPKNPCSPLTIFKGLTLENLIPRLNTCSTTDIADAIADANKQVPIDYTTLACLTPLQPLISAAQSGGVFMAIQTFRDARRNGVLTDCLNWINSTIAPIQ
jgi:hypothetical protein